MQIPSYVARWWWFQRFFWNVHPYFLGKIFSPNLTVRSPHIFQMGWKKPPTTLPETNIAPENGWLED